MMTVKNSSLPEVWAAVDSYFGDLLAPTDAQLDDALRANREANLLIVLWNLAILAGSISLANGGNQGHEYGEYTCR